MVPPVFRLLTAICLTVLMVLPAQAQEQSSPGQTEQAEAAAAPATEPEENAGFRAASAVGVDPEDLKILMVPMTAAQHAELADIWQSHLRRKLETSSDLKIRLRYAEAEGSEHLREAITESQTEAILISDKYQTILESWRSKGGKDEDVEPHQDYIFGFKAESVRTSDFVALANAAKKWLLSREGGLSILMLAVALVVAIYAMRFVAVFLRSRARHRLDRIPHFSELLKRFVLGIVYWLTFMLGIITVLGFFGVPVSALIGVFSGVGFIIGFALKDTLSNLASGLMIMVLKPFDLGDYILVAGSAGTVDDLNIVSTRIRTVDNQLVIIPNSSVWGDVITNVNASPTRRVDLTFRIDYKDDARKAMDILRTLIEEHDLCLSDPEPTIRISELAENSVNIICRLWALTDNMWIVFWDLTLLAKERFEAEGISIPLPRRDVHIVGQVPDASDA